MSKISTTIEQSKHLLELGLDPKTADMSYSEEYFGKDNDGNDEWCWRLNACKFIDVEGIIPAWSLSALLEVMRKTNAVTTLQVTSLSTLLRCKDMGFIWQNDLYINDPTTAAYEMVCYLLRNNLIEKGDNNE